MRDKIWYELMQLRFNLEYIALHVKLQRNLKIRIPVIFIIITLLSGILGLCKPSWSLPAVIVCFLSAWLEIIKLIWKDCLASDHMIYAAEKVYRIYYGLYNKMEKVWLDYEAQKINDDTASFLYSQYKQEVEEKMQEIDEVHFELFDHSIKKKADANVKFYAKTHLS